MKYFVIALLMGLFGYANAHQFTPTYPKLEPSYVEGILQAKMVLFNRRNDVEYYELGVYDIEWNPVPFTSTSKLIKVAYLETKRIDVYVRNSDRKRVVYICTISKLSTNTKDATLISSRICSKVK
jgi:hypothetical protein